MNKKPHPHPLLNRRLTRSSRVYNPHALPRMPDDSQQPHTESPPVKNGQFHGTYHDNLTARYDGPGRNTKYC